MLNKKIAENLAKPASPANLARSLAQKHLQALSVTSPLFHKFLASGLRGKPSDFSNFAAIESASPDLPQQQIDQIRTKMKSYWKEVIKPVLSLDFS